MTGTSCKLGRAPFSPVGCFVIAGLLVHSGCATTLGYQRGLPKRVDRETESTPGTATVELERVGDSLELVVATQVHNETTSTVVHNTFELQTEYAWYSPLGEPLELVFGIGALPFSWMFAFLTPDTGDSNGKVYRGDLYYFFTLAMINPAQTSMFGRLERHATEREEFRSEPTVLRYETRVPQAGVHVACRLLDPSGSEIASVHGKTDEFGTFPLADLPADAVAASCTVAGRRERFPIGSSQ